MVESQISNLVVASSSLVCRSMLIIWATGVLGRECGGSIPSLEMVQKSGSIPLTSIIDTYVSVVQLVERRLPKPNVCGFKPRH